MGALSQCLVFISTRRLVSLRVVTAKLYHAASFLTGRQGKIYIGEIWNRLGRGGLLDRLEQKIVRTKAAILLLALFIKMYRKTRFSQQLFL